jgi:hypothetical protein
MVVMFVVWGLYPIPDEAKEPEPEPGNNYPADDADRPVVKHRSPLAFIHELVPRDQANHAREQEDEECDVEGHGVLVLLCLACQR